MTNYSFRKLQKLML